MTTQYTRRAEEPGTDHQLGMTDEEIETTTESVSQQMRDLHVGGHSPAGDDQNEDGPARA